MAFNKTCEYFDNLKMAKLPIRRGSQGIYYKQTDQWKELRWCIAMRAWITDCPDNCEYISS